MHPRLSPPTFGKPHTSPPRHRRDDVEESLCSEGEGGNKTRLAPYLWSHSTAVRRHSDFNGTACIGPGSRGDIVPVLQRRGTTTHYWSMQSWERTYDLIEDFVIPKSSGYQLPSPPTFWFQVQRVKGASHGVRSATVNPQRSSLDESRRQDNGTTTVAQRPQRSPPTKANRVHSPADYLRTFASGNRVGLSPWLAGFLADLPFSPPFHFGAAPYSSHFTLIGSQDPARYREPSTTYPLHSCLMWKHNLSWQQAVKCGGSCTRCDSMCHFGEREKTKKVLGENSPSTSSSSSRPRVTKSSTPPLQIPIGSSLIPVHLRLLEVRRKSFPVTPNSSSRHRGVFVQQSFPKTGPLGNVGEVRSLHKQTLRSELNFSVSSQDLAVKSRPNIFTHSLQIFGVARAHHSSYCSLVPVTAFSDHAQTSWSLACRLVVHLWQPGIPEEEVIGRHLRTKLTKCTPKYLLGRGPDPAVRSSKVKLLLTPTMEITLKYNYRLFEGLYVDYNVWNLIVTFPPAIYTWKTFTTFNTIPGVVLWRDYSTRRVNQAMWNEDRVTCRSRTHGRRNRTHRHGGDWLDMATSLPLACRHARHHTPTPTTHPSTECYPGLPVIVKYFRHCSKMASTSRLGPVWLQQPPPSPTSHHYPASLALRAEVQHCEELGGCLYIQMTNRRAREVSRTCDLTSYSLVDRQECCDV
ncbi:hypothetical protein PR048_008640 [Dryococelus australis]|uniref:Uncharacterized protein n=1 Tax=Dryococelus australis TaxID=614101 RepID=A0ABQ9HYH7_9NEOP|nr:hypothetical protein PR048_008640 [Dryococelus australis]